VRFPDVIPDPTADDLETWTPVIHVAGGDVEIRLPELVVVARDEADAPIAMVGMAEILGMANEIIAAITRLPTLDQQLNRLPPGAK
jgi:hypothetical protein